MNAMAAKMLGGAVRKRVAPLVVRELLPYKVSYDQEQLDAAIRWCRTAVIGEGNLVAAGYDLRTGWLPPAASATAPLIPTLLHVADLRKVDDAAQLAHDLGRSLLAEQAANGDFGSGAGGPPTVTTDGLLALLALAERAPSTELETAATRSADWLIDNQGEQGQLMVEVNGPQPEGRAVWALARAALVLDRPVYRDAAARHLRWIDAGRRRDGWVGPHSRLETTALARTAEGLLEAGRILGDERAVEAAVGLLVGVERAYRLAGSGVRRRWRNHLVAEIDDNWAGTVGSTAVEGSCRLALVGYRAARLGAAHPRRLRRFADEILDVARSAQLLGGVTAELAGGVPASAPIWAGPGPWRICPVAAKTMVDALLERRDGGLPLERLG